MAHERAIQRIWGTLAEEIQQESELQWCEECAAALDAVMEGVRMRIEELEREEEDET